MGLLRRRPPAVSLLALLYLLSGAMAQLAYLQPLSTRTPVDLLVLLAAVGAVGGGLIWLLGGQFPERTMHGGLVVFSVLLAVLAWKSVTLVGIVELGPVLLVLGLYAVHFCSPSGARAHVAFVLVVTTLGVVASDVSRVAVPWLLNIVATIAVTEVQGRLLNRLRHIATRDPLTGLVNRREWLELTERAIAHAERRNEPLTLALLDLDDFKIVNDERGHHAGDELLVELTEAWNAQLRRSDVLCRYGGDEFALLLVGTDAANAERLLERLAAAHPAPWTGGTAEWTPGDTVDQLLHRADMVLYERKRARKV